MKDTQCPVMMRSQFGFLPLRSRSSYLDPKASRNTARPSPIQKNQGHRLLASTALGFSPAMSDPAPPRDVPSGDPGSCGGPGVRDPAHTQVLGQRTRVRTKQLVMVIDDIGPSLADET